MRKVQGLEQNKCWISTTVRILCEGMFISSQNLFENKIPEVLLLLFVLLWISENKCTKAYFLFFLIQDLLVVNYRTINRIEFFLIGTTIICLRDWINSTTKDKVKLINYVKVGNIQSAIGLTKSAEYVNDTSWFNILKALYYKWDF